MTITRYLNWTEAQRLENDRLWAQEYESLQRLKKLVNTPVALGISSNRRSTKIVALREDRTYNLDEVDDESQVGSIEDLQYFNRKLTTTLRVPDSYLKMGKDDDSTN